MNETSPMTPMIPFPGLGATAAYQRQPGLGLANALTNPPPEMMPREFTPLPVNIKTYLSTLLGNRTGPSLSDFTPGDLDAIRRAAATSMKTTGQSQGTFGYGNYTGTARTPGSRFDEPQGLWSLLMRSFTDPSFRAETTLGQAKYNVNDRGELEVRDTYNFNMPRSEVNAYAQHEGGLQIWKDLTDLVRSGRGNEALETFINMFGTSQEEGKPYTLNLGRLKP